MAQLETACNPSKSDGWSRQLLVGGKSRNADRPWLRMLKRHKKGSVVVWPAPEILGTLFAGEELWEKVDKLPHFLLLCQRRVVGVVRRHGVQEGPGVPAQLPPVQWALRILLRLRLCSRGFLGKKKIVQSDVISVIQATDRTATDVVSNGLGEHRFSPHAGKACPFGASP